MNLYEILGIEKNAPLPLVKAAYRQLAAKYHPDKVPGMENKFNEVQLAYSILSDPDRRERYDRTGRYDDIKVTPRVVQNMVEQVVLGIIQAERPDGTTDDPTWTNVKEKVINTVKHARKEIQATLKRERKKLDRLDNMAKRFRSKTEADPIGDAFAAHRRRILGEVHKHEDALELNFKTEEAFASYDYEVGEVEPGSEGQFNPGSTSRLRGPRYLTDSGISRTG